MGTISKLTTEPRFLNSKNEKKYWEDRSEHPAADRNNLVFSVDKVPFWHTLNAREVLVVYVKYRQNSSMQGSIKGRMTGGAIVSFRSAMELMRMVRMIQF